MNSLFGKIWHVVSWPFEKTAEVVKLLDDGAVDFPKLRTAVADLVKQFGSVSVDVVGDIGARGLNLPDDVKTVVDARAFAGYFADTFLPQIKAVGSELKDDLKAFDAPAAPEAPSAPATAAPVSDPPGLHNTVAA
jgi:hypothetical protein